MYIFKVPHIILICSEIQTVQFTLHNDPNRLINPTQMGGTFEKSGLHTTEKKSQKFLWIKFIGICVNLFGLRDAQIAG